jgi:hypothetical protein
VPARDERTDRLPHFPGEMTMRKIVAGLFMALDGVVESPERRQP